MPKLGANERDILLKQQFIEGINPASKKELLQQPKISYGETVSAAQQLDLAIKFSSNDNERSEVYILHLGAPHKYY